MALFDTCHLQSVVHDPQTVSIRARFWTLPKTNAPSVLSLGFTSLQLFLAIILAFTAGRKLPSLDHR